MFTTVEIGCSYYLSRWQTLILRIFIYCTTCREVLLHHCLSSFSTQLKQRLFLCVPFSGEAAKEEEEQRPSGRAAARAAAQHRPKEGNIQELPGQKEGGGKEKRDPSDKRC